MPKAKESSSKKKAQTVIDPKVKRQEAIMSYVNSIPKPTDKLPVDEVEDVVVFLYGAAEQFLDQKPDTIMSVAIALAPLLFAAVIGNDKIIAQIEDLEDHEIEDLALLSKDYNLGKHADKVQQGVKLLLHISKSATVFMQ